MKIILIGVVALTAVALLEAFFYTMRYLSDRRHDELKRRLSALGSGTGGPVLSGVLRAGKLSSNPAIDAVLRSFRVSAKLETLLHEIVASPAKTSA